VQFSYLTGVAHLLFSVLHAPWQTIYLGEVIIMIINTTAYCWK